MERKTKTHTCFGVEELFILLFLLIFQISFMSMLQFYKGCLPLLSCYGFQATCFIPTWKFYFASLICNFLNISCLFMVVSSVSEMPRKVEWYYCCLIQISVFYWYLRRKVSTDLCLGENPCNLKPEDTQHPKKLSELVEKKFSQEFDNPLSRCVVS